MLKLNVVIPWLYKIDINDFSIAVIKKDIIIPYNEIII